MKKLLFTLALLATMPVFAQTGTQVRPQPDCIIPFTFTAAGSGMEFNNKPRFDSTGQFVGGCITWHLEYSNTGFSVVSIEQQGADASGTAGAAGTYATWSPVASGTTLPLTATTYGQATGYRYQPWVKVKANTLTGTGSVTGMLLGWRPLSGQDASSSTASGGGATAAATTGADAVANTAVASITGATNNPVGVAGYAFNGATWDRIRSSSTNTGSVFVNAGLVGAGGDASSNSEVYLMGQTSASGLGEAVHDYLFNGATWDRARGNTSGQFVQGPAGNGAAAVGNPLFIATDGTKAWALATIGGCAGTAFGCPLALGANGTGADAVSNTLILYPSSSGSTAAQLFAQAAHAFNGTSWDRIRTAVALDAGLSAGVQATHVVAEDNNNGTFSSTVAEGQYRFRTVSATNTAQVVVIDARNLHDTLSIHSACSAGTAALTVEAGADNTNWIQADSIAAAQFQVKVYGATTAGAAAAAAAAGPIAPLAYRYVRVTIATCGVGNTSTLTIGLK